MTETEVTWAGGDRGARAIVGAATLGATLIRGEWLASLWIGRDEEETAVRVCASLGAAKAGALDLWRAWLTEQCAAAGMVAPVAAAQGSAAVEVKPAEAESAHVEWRTAQWVGGLGGWETKEWRCTECDGWHTPVLGGIRVGHPCPRTTPVSAPAPAQPAGRKEDGDAR